MTTAIDSAKEKFNQLSTEVSNAQQQYFQLQQATRNAASPEEYQTLVKESNTFRDTILASAREAALSASDDLNNLERAATTTPAVSFPVPPQAMAESTSLTNAGLPALTESAKQAAASIVGPANLGDEDTRIGEYSRLTEKLPFLGIRPLGLNSGGLGTSDGKVSAGAQRTSPPKSQVKLKTALGTDLSVDLRIKIKPPAEYLVSFMGGKSNDFIALDGVVFPYTPSISYAHKADYTSQGPLHSNFTQYFYKNSSVSAIAISGKFTVQNDQDAYNFLSAVHILRALTKMRSGGFSADATSGSPPPVCKLEGYGKYMFSGVPVVIGDFKVENADSIDYYNFAQQSDQDITSVPVVSTISVTCIPMYSRKEMQEFNIPDFLTKYNESRTKGYI